MTAEMLRVEALTRRFGGIVVSDGVSVALEAGERVALIGPNGAGKTTFVNLVSGALRPSAGRVFLMGEDVTRLSEVARVHRGLVRTFQISRLFKPLTVREHVELVLLRRDGRTGAMLASPHLEVGLADEAQMLLIRLGLQEMQTRQVRELAYGQQRLVELAMALALRPNVLLLDEPAAGVPQADSARIVEAIDSLPADLAVLLIEHDMDLVFRFARRVIVLASGRIIAEGPPSVVAVDPRVREAYLGSYARGRPAA